MASNYDTNNDRKGFSFIWVLENFEYCWQKFDETLDSPTFIVDTIERTKWSLSIYPRGNISDGKIVLFLCREPDSKGPATIEVDYELAYLASDGTVLNSPRERNYTYSMEEPWGVPEIQEREFVFANRSMFLPRGVLTIRCRMWKSTGEVKRDGQCVTRTRIGVERKAFFWKIPKFSSFLVGRETTFRLKSTSDDEPIMTLIMFLHKFRKFREDICIKFFKFNRRIVFSTFKASLVDAHGDYLDCGEYEFWFSPNSSQSLEIKLPLSKNKLMKNYYRYLPNDVLTLYCEQVFSTDIVLEGIEGTSYGCSGSFITNNVISENLETDDIEKSDSETPSALKLDLSSMLLDNILCDVKLSTESEIFHAHWFILCTRSPVFRAMFKSDMKEKAKDQIDIQDLKPDTVRRMLLYMYTDSLEEQEWETTSDLYVAAEKYQITSLKDKCSSFLRNSLSLSNACEILFLADLHQDKDLKSNVQDFISKNKSVINSSEWELLMQANMNLATETLRLKE